MNQRMIQTALAKFQRGDVPGDVVAVFDRETGSPGLDGRKWRFVVTNGQRFVPVEAELTGSQGGSRERAFDARMLEAAVERCISTGCYRHEFLMDEVAADGALSLRADDLRPYPPRDHSIFF